MLKFPSSSRYADRPTARKCSQPNEISARVRCSYPEINVHEHQEGLFDGSGLACMRRNLTYSSSASIHPYSLQLPGCTHDCCAVYTYTPRTTRCRLPFFRHYPLSYVRYALGRHLVRPISRGLAVFDCFLHTADLTCRSVAKKNERNARPCQKRRR